jgi:sulfate adenylyltransferase subunit 1 (EFTu-like GTPase family)
MPRGRFRLRHTANDVRTIVTDVLYKVDISTLKKHSDVKEFQLNYLGYMRLRTISPLLFEIYSKNRTTGSFVLVDSAMQGFRMALK